MTKSELCNYCFNAGTIEGPDAEEVPCPICQPTSAVRHGGKSAFQLAHEAWGVEYSGEDYAPTRCNQESEDWGDL